MAHERSTWRATAAAGAVGCLLALAAAALLSGSAWRGWLAAAFLWSSAPTGAVVLVMIMRLVPGVWAEELTRTAEGWALLTPLSVLLMLPMAFVLGDVYPWFAQQQATPFRAAWLSGPSVVGRAVIWFAFLSALIAQLSLGRRPGRTAASIGLIVFMILDTFITTDWLSSLDPEFASSGFALYVICTQILLALVLSIGAALLSGSPPRRPGVLGGLLLTLLLLWSYFAFMHYFIIWSDDLPAGVRWYGRRAGPLWSAVMLMVAVGRLAPAFMLLFASVRRSRLWLMIFSAVILVSVALEVGWLVLPSVGDGNVDVGVLTVFLLASTAMGALIFGAFSEVLSWRRARAGAA